MADQLAWLEEAGYVDDQVEGAVVLHRDLPNKARVLLRLDEQHWSVVSYADRAEGGKISFVMTGIPEDQLPGRLKQCEAELAWLVDQFQGK